MRLQHLNQEILNKSLLNIFGKYLCLEEYKIFYFGSRVNGKGSERSDIDIGLYGKNPIHSSIVSSIQEDIENLPILYTIEVIDFSTVSDEFRKLALQNIEEIK